MRSGEEESGQKVSGTLLYTGITNIETDSEKKASSEFLDKKDTDKSLSVNLQIHK